MSEEAVNDLDTALSVERLTAALNAERQRSRALVKEVKALKRRNVAMAFRSRMAIDSLHDALDTYGLDEEQGH
ncbi:hypothetical protein [Gordonia alkanivorans]|uniref:hypothetical protein n=1 Tax=Gordonia alkanivorans TaxID=84096 RepID=UPI00244B0BD6|nr:hypothetical protein [Gordonia alkanivorans]MDH3045045.1 hypothetical protein [Gordonia alkanivorans]